MRTSRLAPATWADQSRTRRGFTLIELLVVVSILLILTVMTVSAINFTVSGDRIRSAARQVQSYVAGARDRAIYAKQIRGVRLFPDPTNSNMATSMVYVGVAPDYTQGQITFDFSDPNRQLLSAVPPAWATLQTDGLLPATGAAGVRIQIPFGDPNATWYTVVNRTVAGAPRWQTTTPLASGLVTGTPLAYRVRVLPTVLPNQQPIVLGKGIAIDLTKSFTPWTVGGTAPMDVLFTPQGAVTGSALSKGGLHLYLCDVVNVNSGTYLDDDRLVSVFARTGNISCHPVRSSGGSRFDYAIAGEVAGQ